MPAFCPSTRSWLRALTTAAWLCGAALSVAAADPRPFEVGDEVQVLEFRRWREGLVVKSEGRFVWIDIDSPGFQRQKKYLKDQVRYPWQANAITPIRFWSDASGQFKIQGSATAIDKDAQKVTLYRIDRSTEITLDIDQLSDQDQRYLKKYLSSAAASQTINGSAPPFPSLPDVESFEPAPERQPPWADNEDVSSIAPDPPKVSLGVPMGGAGFYKTSRQETVNSVFPIGSSAGWMLAGTTHGSSRTSVARFVWATLSDGKLQKQHAVPDGLRILAVAPESQSVLTVGVGNHEPFDSPWRSKQVLTVWKASPRTETAKPVRRWISDDGRSHSSRGDAAFVSASRVMHFTTDKKLVVWDFVEGRGVYSIEQESFFGARPAVSPGARYLALPEDKRLRIIRTHDGKTLASLSIDGGRAAGAAFDAAGQRLAVLTNRKILIWNLGSPSPPDEFNATGLRTSFSRRIEFVNDRYLLVDGDTLFDLQMELPVWKYVRGSDVAGGRRNERTMLVADGKLCYAAEVRDPRREGMVVGAVDLPGPTVDATVGRVDREGLYVINPGERVALEVDCGEYDSQVRAALEQQIADNGWELTDRSVVRLVATMGRGKRQTRTYIEQRTGEKQQASATPYFSRLKLMMHDETIFSTGTGSSLPSSVYLQSGETIQGEINKQQRPNPGMFDTVDLPARFFDPKFSDGFGTSRVTLRGLQANVKEGLPLK